LIDVREKIMHLKSKLPLFLAMIVPDSMTDIVEYSWNSFPHCRTEYYNAYYGDKFMLSVETMHANDRGSQENAVNLPPEDLEKRRVDYINISCSDSYVKMVDGEDPTKFLSKKTGRGNLRPTFIEDHDPVMCCYKVVKLRFKVFALQTKVESWGQQYGIRNPFLQYHRKLFCWIDEWFGMSMEDIRKMEQETAVITKRKLEESLLTAKSHEAP
jgi:Phosphatidylinositol transfer protein